MLLLYNISQPVKYQQEIYHKECFIKLLIGGTEIGANYFFPVVNQYLLGGEIDKLVLQEIATMNESVVFSINISSCTVKEEKLQKMFLALVKKLIQKTNIKIHFELSEFIIVEHMDAAASLIHALGQMGQVVGLDRIGATFMPLDYLKKLNLSFIKLDGSLSVGIEKSKLKQEMIVNWIVTSKHLDLVLVATMVESESQWQTLNQLGVTYFQGNYVHSPILMS